MLEPHNVTTLQNFLGLANYYQTFIKNMHELCALLNVLLKNDKKKNEIGRLSARQHLRN